MMVQPSEYRFSSLGGRRRLRLESLENRRLLAVYTVATFADRNNTIPDEAQLSLREAILLANENSGEDTIRLPAGIYELSIAGVDEDGGLTGDLDITDSLIIEGLGENSLSTVIDANQLDRVLDIFRFDQLDDLPNLTLRNLRLVGGQLQFGFQGSSDGGGVQFRANDLNLFDVVIANNSVSGSGGGLFFEGNELAIVRSSIEGNVAEVNGGGISAASNLGTAAPTAILITDSSITGNRAEGQPSPIASAFAIGGGLYASQLGVAIANSTISNNQADLDGGGLYLTENQVSLIQFSTIYNNVVLDPNPATAPAGSNLRQSSGDVIQLQNNIFAEPGVGPASGLSTGNNIVGSNISSSGGNLADDEDDNLSDTIDLLSLDPALEQLTRSTLGTFFHRPAFNSPAVDAAITASDFNNLGLTDQIGTNRSLDGNGDGVAQPDIGAIELPTSFTIGSAVYLDVNKDGIQQSDEAGIADVPVFLFLDIDENGIFDSLVDLEVDSVLSAEQGDYSFAGLTAGSYFVHIPAAAFTGTSEFGVEFPGPLAGLINTVSLPELPEGLVRSVELLDSDVNPSTFLVADIGFASALLLEVETVSRIKLESIDQIYPAEQYYYLLSVSSQSVYEAKNLRLQHELLANASLVTSSALIFDSLIGSSPLQTLVDTLSSDLILPDTNSIELIIPSISNLTSAFALFEARVHESAIGVVDSRSTAGTAETVSLASITATSQLPIIPLVNLSVSAAANQSEIEVGEATTITITVTNDGPSIAEQLSLQTSLPTGLSIESVRVAGGASLPNELLLELHNYPLFAGQLLSIEMVLRATAEMEAINIVSFSVSDVSADELELANNFIVVVVNVYSVPIVVVTPPPIVVDPPPPLVTPTTAVLPMLPITPVRAGEQVYDEVADLDLALQPVPFQASSGQVFLPSPIPAMDAAAAKMLDQAVLQSLPGTTVLDHLTTLNSDSTGHDQEHELLPLPQSLRDLPSIREPSINPPLVIDHVSEAELNGTPAWVYGVGGATLVATGGWMMTPRSIKQKLRNRLRNRVSLARLLYSGGD